MGKSTLSTNVAGYYASQGHPVILGVWILKICPPVAGLRPATVAPSAGGTPMWMPWPAAQRAPRTRCSTRPQACTAGALKMCSDGRQGHRAAAAQHLRHLRPQAFLDKLREHRHAAGVKKWGVGMRIDERTRSAEQLHHFVEGLGLPVLGYVRDTQNYMHLAARGLSVFDVGATTRVARDLEQWQSICQWLDA